MNTQPTSIMSLKTRLSPEAFARALMSRGPVFWSEADSIWIATTAAGAEAVLKSPDYSADRSGFFAARMPHIPPSAVGTFFAVVSKMMVASDGAQHAARRRLAAAGLTDRSLDDFAPRVAEAVDRLVARVADKARFEFVAEIAQDLPSMVLADLFCVDERERAAFYDRANKMTQFFGAGPGCPMTMATDANESAVELRDWFASLIAARRATPRDDFMSALVRAQGPLGLDDSEIISQAIMMLVAGKVTTTDQISNNLNVLLSQPGLIASLARSAEHIDAAVEEATRLDPAVNFIFRVATRDLALEGAEVRAGQPVFVSLHAVNRDARLFESPHEFKLDRARSNHFSYGTGAHHCLGSKLARIQMRALFRSLIMRYPTLWPDTTGPGEASVRKHQSLAFSGFEALAVIK